MHKSLKNIFKELNVCLSLYHTYGKYNSQFSSIETIQVFTERYPEEMDFDEIC